MFSISDAECGIYCLQVWFEVLRPQHCWSRGCTHRRIKVRFRKPLAAPADGMWGFISPSLNWGGGHWTGLLRRGLFGWCGGWAASAQGRVITLAGDAEGHQEALRGALAGFLFLVPPLLAGWGGKGRSEWPWCRACRGGPHAGPLPLLGLTGGPLTTAWLLYQGWCCRCHFHQLGDFSYVTGDFLLPSLARERRAEAQELGTVSSQNLPPKSYPWMPCEDGKKIRQPYKGLENNCALKVLYIFKRNIVKEKFYKQMDCDSLPWQYLGFVLLSCFNVINFNSRQNFSGDCWELSERTGFSCLLFSPLSCSVLLLLFSRWVVSNSLRPREL